MTPDQKEAYRREVLEEAAKVADVVANECHAMAIEFSPERTSTAYIEGERQASKIAAAIRALAASQPSPAADTLQAIRNMFNVAYRADGEVAGVAYGSEALPEVVRLLDAALASQPVPVADTGQAVAWIPGEPPKPWRDEWFIARLTYGERAVLRALPEEFTYDYTTADETYLKADRIKAWMQFPDSEYLPLDAERVTDEMVVIACKAHYVEHPVEDKVVTRCREDNMRAAIRAALRQKEGGQ